MGHYIIVHEHRHGVSIYAAENEEKALASGGRIVLHNIDEIDNIDAEQAILDLLCNGEFTEAIQMFNGSNDANNGDPEQVLVYESVVLNDVKVHVIAECQRYRKDYHGY